MVCVGFTIPSVDISCMIPDIRTILICWSFATDVYIHSKLVCLLEYYLMEKYQLCLISIQHI